MNGFQLSAQYTLKPVQWKECCSSIVSACLHLNQTLGHRNTESFWARPGARRNQSYILTLEHVLHCWKRATLHKVFVEKDFPIIEWPIMQIVNRCAASGNGSELLIVRNDLFEKIYIVKVNYYRVATRLDARSKLAKTSSSLKSKRIASCSLAENVRFSVSGCIFCHSVS